MNTPTPVKKVRKPQSLDDMNQAAISSLSAALEACNRAKSGEIDDATRQKLDKLMQLANKKIAALQRTLTRVQGNIEEVRNNVGELANLNIPSILDNFGESPRGSAVTVPIAILQDLIKPTPRTPAVEPKRETSIFDRSLTSEWRDGISGLPNLLVALEELNAKGISEETRADLRILLALAESRRRGFEEDGKFYANQNMCDIHTKPVQDLANEWQVTTDYNGLASLQEKIDKRTRKNK